MKLSIVSTLYQSAPYIEEFIRRCEAVAHDLVGNDYEIILVNDGSPDDSLAVAVAQTEKNPKVTLIDLSRNFGHHKAMMTGLAAATGARVFLVDSDLEEEPEWLLSFAQQMDTEKSDVVYGVQEKRRGQWFERMTGHVFYRLFRMLTGVAQPDNIVTARLMSARYVAALVSHGEREINIGGLWMATGFAQSQQRVVKLSASPTTYSLRRKLGHLVNAVTSFSSMPLVLTFYAGLLISLTGAIYVAYLFARYLFVAAPPGGYTSIVASIWVLSGLIIFFLGVQGIYIAKIFSEVKQRPYTIIRHIYRNTTQKD